MDPTMESSVVSAIEKIKQQEQNQEAIFKEKREYEATKAALKRSIQDTIAQSQKFDLERLELLKKTDELQGQLTIHKIRRDMLLAQLADSTKVLNDLKEKTAQSISELHELRSNYCKAVHEVVDDCDVWALLKRPTPQTAPLKPLKKIAEYTEPVLVNEERLKAAVKRREEAIAERQRLLAEPDEGSEFVRIKNALRYSMEMSATLRK